jgi:ABC-2 type transport system permease protein
MRPLTDNDPAPLILVAITVALLVAASMVLAGRRDVGAGVLASRDVVPLRRFGLSSPLGLASRLEMPTLLAWWIGTAAAAFAFGIIAKIATGDIPSSLGDTLDKYGVQGTFLQQFLGIAFVLLATMVALLPAGQLGAAAEEETSGRLVNVLVRPVSRRATLASRLLLATVGVAVAGVLAGLASWAGAATQGLDAGLGSMVVAGLNVVPTALVALGIGAVVGVVAPRRAAAAVYAVVIWSSLVDLVGPIVPGLGGLERVSLFHAMARAPAEDPDPLTIVLTLLLALVLIVVAIVLFDRRDVETG